MVPRVGEGADRRVAWWRLWAVQGGFEPSGQQWSGWLVCMAPWLRTALDSGARIRWLETEPTSLNTNPYVFGLLVGVRQRVEEEHGLELARRVTTGLQSALGALGDALLWSAWRPSFALLAAALGVFGGGAAVVGVWLVFAAMQAWLRQAALHWGKAQGLAAIEGLARLDAPGWTQRGRVFGALLAGWLSTIVVQSVLAGGSNGPTQGMGLAVATLGGMFIAWRRIRGEVAILWTAAVMWILARASGAAG